MKNECKWRTLTLLLLLATLSANAQVLARISVKAGASRRLNTAVYTALKNANQPGLDSLQLFEIRGNKRSPVPFQLLNENLYWVMEGPTAAGNTRVYELVKGNSVATSNIMQLKDTAGAFLLRQGNRKLLQYNYAIVEPPAGLDTVYRRSGFIHPLWAPDGQVITNIHPKGHWHHVGIWNPWTHTSFKGKETDFWNLQKKEGTVRFKGVAGRVQGPVACGFTVLQEHIAFSGGKEVTAINEEWVVKALNCGTDTSRFVWDFASTLNCADTAGITLLQYRYGGGFGLRTMEAWTAATSAVLTSEGKTRKDADSTRARWIKITGRTEKGQAGILIMNHPGNFDSPQPLRVWPENSERGEIMMNFSPTKMKEWILQYGRYYAQRYRVVTFIKDLTNEEIENYYQDYVKPPEVTVVWNGPI